MIIKIEDLEQKQDGTIKVCYEKENKELGSKNLIKADLTVKKFSSAVSIKGKITGWVEKVCDRCLKTFKYNVDEIVDETISLTPLFNYSNKEIHLKGDQLDDELLDSDEIDIDNFIYQSVTLSFPNKLVCDINCNVDSEYVKNYVQDPRLEIFKKLKKDK